VISRPFEQLFTSILCLRELEGQPDSLQQVARLRHDRTFREKLWSAHKQNKAHLVELLTPWNVREDVLPSRGPAGRTLQASSLILQRPDRLVEIATKHGGLQILFAGKATRMITPDGNIKEILNIIDSLEEHRHYLKAIFLENYDTSVQSCSSAGWTSG